MKVWVYATVRTKDREDYEDDGFREMVTAVDGYLTEKEYKGSITLEWDFKMFEASSWRKNPTTPATIDELLQEIRTTNMGNRVIFLLLTSDYMIFSWNLG